MDPRNRRHRWPWEGCAGKDGVARRGQAQPCVNWVFLGKNGWSRVPMQSEIRLIKARHWIN